MLLSSIPTRNFNSVRFCLVTSTVSQIREDVPKPDYRLSAQYPIV